MECKPVKEHEWLKRFVGEWTYESECPAEPGGQPMKFTGREVVRALGDLWIHGEGRGEMPGGGEAVMVTTVGFDPAAGRFVGTWVGSMMTHLWAYQGWLEGEDTLVLEATGPNFEKPGETATFRDITEFKGRDLRIFRGTVRQEDGSWKQLMNMEFRRVR